MISSNASFTEIKNPISLARLVLDASTKPLSLQRVPPNLLVGPGAANFACDNGMPVLPHDFLISTPARERWLRWKQDLKIAEHRDQDDCENDMDVDQETTWSRSTSDDRMTSATVGNTPPESPPSTEATTLLASTSTSITPPIRPLVESASDTPNLERRDYIDYSFQSACSLYNPFRDQGSDGLGQGHPKKTKFQEAQAFTDDDVGWAQRAPKLPKLHDGSSDSDSSMSSISSMQLPSVSPSPPPFAALHTPLPPSPSDQSSESIKTETGGLSDAIGDMSPLPMTSNHAGTEDRDDEITDTVGAIAVDCYGNIAAGSSSGGIGMKHRGRTGPAALVGVGSAVIPVDPEDPHKVCVATVTSGTGEHMATTMAASTCAERIYANVRKKRGGGIEYATEEEAMRSMIEKEFMGMSLGRSNATSIGRCSQILNFFPDHPGVKHSHCAGAIGVMAIKKSREGVFFYFGHNTDSFVSPIHLDNVLHASNANSTTRPWLP